MTNNNSQIVPDFSILWRVLNFSCQISSYILLHNYGMKSFLGPQFPKTFCLLCPESDPISRCFWPHLVLSSRAHKQAEELKGMLFFSCLPEWCHPHSDSAYTKYSAALSIHCHHGYSTASATQPALLPRPTPAATGQRSWLTGSPSNGSGSQWCHGEDETRAKARRARDHLLTHHLREVVVDFSMKGGSLGFERFKVQKKHTIIQRLLQVWSTYPQNGLFGWRNSKRTVTMVLIQPVLFQAERKVSWGRWKAGSLCMCWSQAPESLNPELHEYKYLTGGLSQWGGRPETNTSGPTVGWMEIRDLESITCWQMKLLRQQLAGIWDLLWGGADLRSNVGKVIFCVWADWNFPFVFHLFLTSSPAAVAQPSRTRPAHRRRAFDVIWRVRCGQLKPERLESPV